MVSREFTDDECWILEHMSEDRYLFVELVAMDSDSHQVERAQAALTSLLKRGYILIEEGWPDPRPLSNEAGEAVVRDREKWHNRDALGSYWACPADNDAVVAAWNRAYRERCGNSVE